MFRSAACGGPTGGGANIDAGVRVPAGDHVGRERLCRYITRPPFAIDRFTELPDGRIEGTGGMRGQNRAWVMIAAPSWCSLR